MSLQYMRSNPLNQHNAPLAVSSKDIQGHNTGTGNMYQGQGGRAFIQGGGGASQYYSANVGGPNNAFANGSYAPVTVGSNSMTKGGSRRGRGRGSGSKRKQRKTSKKCKCDIVTGVGGRRGRGSRSRSCSHTCHIKNCKCACHHSRSRRVKQHGGSGFYANAAYSIGGANTGINKFSSALASPAPYSAYNSCHPVA